MPDTIIVIPCYNECARLPAERLRRFALESNGTQLLFVDDGSRDGTRQALLELCEPLGDAAQVLGLDQNAGKAEAVRQGCLAAFASNPQYVGYWDADLATPLELVADFQALLDERSDIEIVFGARVQLLGRSIQRNTLRHYFGRLFATAAAHTLGLDVYDTQCGAKLFRASQIMQLLFRRPFLTRWLFDVELLARLIQGTRLANLRPAQEMVYELPLRQWHEVPGSKVKPLDLVKGLVQLGRIRQAYLARELTDADCADWLALPRMETLPEMRIARAA